MDRYCRYTPVSLVNPFIQLRNFLSLPAGSSLLLFHLHLGAVLLSHIQIEPDTGRADDGGCAIFAVDGVGGLIEPSGPLPSLIFKKRKLIAGSTAYVRQADAQKS